MKVQSEHSFSSTLVALAAIFFFVDLVGAQAPTPKLGLSGYVEVPYTPRQGDNDARTVQGLASDCQEDEK